VSLEEQFDREQNIQADTGFRELTTEERTEILAAVRLLLEHPEHEVLMATKRVLGLLHKIAGEGLFIPKVGMASATAHNLDEVSRARCAALIDAIELPTDEKGLLAIMNNLHKE
jgi:hypothetical protein